MNPIPFHRLPFLRLLPITALFVLATLAEAQPWTHYAVEGEDATSSHHYFYLVSGESVERVRWVWSGGAQNAPTATDYLVEKDRIVVRHHTVSRERLKELVAGKDAGMSAKEEYAIRTGGKPLGEVLRRRLSLSKARRSDLESLEGILAMDRRRMP